MDYHLVYDCLPPTQTDIFTSNSRSTPGIPTHCLVEDSLGIGDAIQDLLVQLKLELCGLGETSHGPGALVEMINMHISCY